MEGNGFDSNGMDWNNVYHELLTHNTLFSSPEPKT